jgi:hypothetical protein
MTVMECALLASESRQHVRNKPRPEGFLPVAALILFDASGRRLSVGPSAANHCAS